MTLTDPWTIDEMERVATWDRRDLSADRRKKFADLGQTL
jgi:hypothetical protein